LADDQTQNGETDVTPAEISKELASIKNEAGANAYASLHVDCDGYATDSVYAVLYPYGMCSTKGSISVRGKTFEKALVDLREKWAKYSDEHRSQTIRSMALAIIRLTTETGDCTDAALRQEFDAAQIARWGDDACKLADEMAGKGPFSIKRKRGANAA